MKRDSIRKYSVIQCTPN